MSPTCVGFIADHRQKFRLRSFSLLATAVATITLTGVGCGTFQSQSNRRCEQCSELCKQACDVNQQGYPEQAELLLKQAKKRQPTDLETRRQLAESLWECGRPDDAMHEYSDLAREFPRDKRLKERLAAMAFLQKQFTAALEHADAALMLDPRSVEAMLVKARVQVVQKNLDDAATTYISLVDVVPHRGDIKLELADIQLQRGHTSQVCTLLREVIADSQRDPVQRAEAEWRLGLAYASANRWVEAVEHLDRAKERRPMSDSDRRFLDLVHAQAGMKQIMAASFGNLPVQITPEAHTCWTDLRDHLVTNSGASHDDSDAILRADFSSTPPDKRYSFRTDE